MAARGGAPWRPEAGGRVGLSWSEDIDAVVGGDRVVMLVYATPAAGAVLLPVNNFALRDRAAGTISAVNSSVGAWRKLERIRRAPRVALAYHSRAHSDREDPRFVLVQGRATLGPPVPDYPARLGADWERFEPWSQTPALWRWWQRVYALRVQIDVTVERVLVWPDLACVGEPKVTGAPLPLAPGPQQPPGNGTAPRLNAARAARAAARLPHVLLGWVGADGYPMAAPVEVVGGDGDGIELRAAPGLLPPGGRRAGLTAHWFSRGSIGQHQRKHTGWLEAGERLIYSPHTASNYRFPASPTPYRLLTGGATRRGLPGARRAGFLDS
jgi:hypothetical protein